MKSIDLIAAAGRLMHGDAWQSALSHDLGVADRTVRRWVAGDQEPPPGVLHQVAGLLNTWAQRAGPEAARIGAALLSEAYAVTARRAVLKALRMSGAPMTGPEIAKAAALDAKAAAGALTHLAGAGAILRDGKRFLLADWP